MRQLVLLYWGCVFLMYLSEVYHPVDVQIEGKQTDAAPVQGADDGQDQCDFINHHEQTSIHALRQGLSLDCPLLAKPYMNGTFCGWNCKRQGNVL